jgi:hypothetical protein
MADIDIIQYDPTTDYAVNEGEGGDEEVIFPHPFGRTKDQLFWDEKPGAERAKPVYRRFARCLEPCSDFVNRLK